MRSNFSCVVLLFVLSTCACCCCCSCHRVCVSKLDVLHSKCLVLQSRGMHVGDRAPTGSLLQLKAAAKACRMGLQGGSLNYRSRLHRGPAGSALAAPAGPRLHRMPGWHLYRKCEILGCYSTNNLKHLESCLPLTVSWCAGCHRWTAVWECWDLDSDKPEIWWSGPVRSCIQSGWARHASVMQCQVFIKSPVGNLKYEWELFYAYQQIYYSRS